MAKASVALILSLCMLLPVGAAQLKSETKKPARPAWSELTPAQRQILAPLAPDWDRMDTTRRKKWVKIAERYPKMKPEAQKRLLARMQEWAKLTPEQRSLAREKFRTLKKMPPKKRREVRLKWEEYQRAVAAQDEAAVESPQGTGDTSGGAARAAESGAAETETRSTR